jgi:hypothetical protein
VDRTIAIALSSIAFLLSGSPIKVQSGLDLDRDLTVTGDLPPGIPITIGREQVDESLSAINTFRATQGLAPVDRSLLSPDPYRSLDVRLTKRFELATIV